MMQPAQTFRASEPGAFRIVAEAVHALRTAPVATLACYYAGAVPFVGAFLYFWADLSGGLIARTSCADEALALAALFLWMKFWQTVYCSRLRAQVLGRADERWTPGRAWRVLTTQAEVQTAGLFLLPLAFVTLVFFPATYCFFQNATVLGGAAKTGGAGTVARAWRQAARWPRQAVVLVWGLSPWLPVGSVAGAIGLFLLARGHESLQIFMPLVLLPLLVSPVGVALMVNVAVMLAAGPWFLQTFLGVQTTFRIAGESAVLNSTFLASVSAIVYLCLDPVMKAACVLRCHYGESLATGEDLTAELAAIRAEGLRDARSWHGAAVTLALGLFLLAGATPARAAAEVPSSATEAISAKAEPPAPAQAADTGAVNPDSLDRAISEVLTGRLYQWRLPPDEAEKKAVLAKEDEASGWFGTFCDRLGAALERMDKRVGDWSDRFDKWLRHLFGLDRKKTEKPRSVGSGYGLPRLGGLYIFLYSLLASVAAALAIVILRRVQERRRAGQVQAQPAALPAKPDLESEDVRADRLPTDEWVALARELAARGEYRLALRALFLSGLAWLAARDLLRIARAKSNREYERELRRRAHSRPEVVESFAGNARVFDAVWYGSCPADAPLFAAFEERLEGMRRHAE